MSKPQTLATFPVSEILPLIGGLNKSRKTLTVDGVPYRVQLGDVQFRLFKRSLRCVGCGIEGNVFELKVRTKGSPHKPIHNCFLEDCGWCGRKNERQNLRNLSRHSTFLNLYHVTPQGKKILMTKDHIYPKCRGGTDGLYNLQTMCTHCNNKKGSEVVS
jgi:5-methylcytosine-specific restriction endonuclease McrA